MISHRLRFWEDLLNKGCHMKEYILAKTADLDTVFNIVQNSIKSTYPKYYPKEVVDFFCNLRIVHAFKNRIV